LNALSIVARVTRRNPAYVQSEYLDEVNSAYKECWDYITQLEDSYFTDTKILTVITPAAEFDLLTNPLGNLSSPVSLRAFQISRIRILPPGAVRWSSARPRSWNDDDFLAQSTLTPQINSTADPFLYTIFAKFSLLFAQPLPAGTQIEVVYNFIWMPLVILTNGTVTSSGTTVTGATTTFTQVVPPDYQAALPGNDQDTDIGLELIDPTGLTYRVRTVTSDTSLTLLNAPVPAFTNAYTLATVPDIPDGHHDVIATIATRNFMSTPGNDARFPTWAALAEQQKDAMRDTIMQRQRQEPARVKPFPGRLMRHQASR
jgi:hypothetical protein